MLLYIYPIVTLFDVLYSFPHYVFLLVITFIGLKCWNFVPSAFIFLKTFLVYVLFWKVFLLDMELWLAVPSHSCWKVECKLDFLLLVNFSFKKKFFFICSEFCHTLKWNSHGFTCVPRSPLPPPSPPAPSRSSQCTRSERLSHASNTPMFIAALFIIARTWKQPRCPSADEWIRKLWLTSLCL